MCQPTGGGEKSFGTRLRELREEKRMTLRGLAVKAGMDHSYLSKIETGKREPPSREICMKIGAALSLCSEDIIKFLELAGHYGKRPDRNREIPEPISYDDLQRKAARLVSLLEERQITSLSWHYALSEAERDLCDILCPVFGKEG